MSRVIIPHLEILACDYSPMHKAAPVRKAHFLAISWPLTELWGLSSRVAWHQDCSQEVQYNEKERNVNPLATFFTHMRFDWERTETYKETCFGWHKKKNLFETSTSTRRCSCWSNLEYRNSLGKGVWQLGEAAISHARFPSAFYCTAEYYTNGIPSITMIPNGWDGWIRIRIRDGYWMILSRCYLKEIEPSLYTRTLPATLCSYPQHEPPSQAAPTTNPRVGWFQSQSQPQLQNQVQV